MTFPFIIGASQQKRSFRPLYMIWKTTTINESITLPLVNTVGYNYNFIIDWGDGSVGQVTSFADIDKTHIYTSAGNYTAKIMGICNGFNLGYKTEAPKLIEIWGGKDMVFKSFSFQGCTNMTRADIPDIDVSAISALTNVFYNCSKMVTCNIQNWNTSASTNFSGFFYGCSLLPAVDISGWDVSLSTSFAAMFRDCSKLTSLNLNSWTFNSTSNINFSQVFQSTSVLTTIGTDLSGWNTEKFTNLSYCFGNSGIVSLPGCSSWDVSNVTTFSSMFYYAKSISSLNLNSWTFSSTSWINTSNMFHFATSLTTIGTDLSGWNTGKWNTANHMFYNCSKLESLSGCNSWDVSNVTSFSGFFYGCSLLVNPVLTSWNVTLSTSFNFMFKDCRGITSLDLGGWVINTTNNVDFAGMFSGCTYLTSITTTDLSNWDTKKVTSFASMFGGCSSLTSVDCDHWDVSLSTNFSSMFYQTHALTSLDLNGWRFNTTSNINTTSMFMYNNGLTTIGTDLSGWNTGKFTTFQYMFYSCVKLASLPNIGSWDTSASTSFLGLFYGCSLLVNPDVSGWDVSLSTSFASMFQLCGKITSLDCSSWTFNSTSNISFNRMFANCYTLTTIGTYSGWNTGKVTDVAYMFYQCFNITTIDISGWDLSLVTAVNMTQYMFSGCNGLTSLTLPSSLSRVDNQFAVFTGTPAIAVYNINRSAAPTVSGTPFGNYAKPLHVPVGATGYNVAPWTNTAIFSSIIADL